jgi:hypothetical protein
MITTRYHILNGGNHTVKERIQFEGLLRATDKESGCRGWCSKVTLYEGTLPIDVAFADYQISDDSVSPRLQDGTYELFVHGKTTRVMRVNGRWIY